MDVGINNVIYMELHSGPKMANSTCGKTIVAGTIDRGSTVLLQYACAIRTKNDPETHTIAWGYPQNSSVNKWIHNVQTHLCNRLWFTDCYKIITKHFSITLTVWNSHNNALKHLMAMSQRISFVPWNIHWWDPMLHLTFMVLFFF